jgi:ribosomal protein S18 acetylase RimI-like enzyme
MHASPSGNESLKGIMFRSDLEGIKAEHLVDFFVGWPDPPTPQRHLEVLAASHGIEIAVDESTGHVVGFINAISDGLLTAYIPLLEVLPEYQGRGIARVLIDHLLARYRDLYMIDLCCDEEVVPIYEPRGFKQSIGMVLRNYDRQSAGA